MNRSITAGRTREQLWATLFVPQCNVFAVVDGARASHLLAQLHALQPEHLCLYRGRLEPNLAAAAPYLVRLEYEHPFTHWLLTQGWGLSWGIFAHTDTQVDLKTMRKHFRTFLMVESPQHKPMYFRYYDPRVLRAYLPLCNAQEQRIIFSPVRAYLVEAQSPSFAVQFSSERGHILIQNKSAA